MIFFRTKLIFSLLSPKTRFSTKIVVSPDVFTLILTLLSGKCNPNFFGLTTSKFGFAVQIIDCSRAKFNNF
jgi:hypothetical protein